VLEEAPAVHEEEGQKNKILEETLNLKAPSMNPQHFFTDVKIGERHKYFQVLKEAPAVHKEEGQKNKILEETLNPKAPYMNSTTFLHRCKNWRET
jgi:L-lactate utilization protein LutB